MTLDSKIMLLFIYVQMYAVLPIIVGVWSMVVMLWQQLSIMFEYFLNY